MWEAVLVDLALRTGAPRVAARFHHGLARAIRDTVARVRAAGPDGAALDTVALSGGCLQNKLLTETLVELLEADGLRCLTHARVPANDGGLALGQAAVAAARQLGPGTSTTRRGRACV
jgi:hydrogenase maturation protein HypF